MSAKAVVDKLKETFTTIKQKDICFERENFFPEVFGANSLSKLLEEFDFKEDDEKWEQLRAQKKPVAKYSKIRTPRLCIAFLASGLRSLREQYTSGKDDEPLTDVDVMRLGAHYTQNAVFRLDHISARLSD